MRKLFLIAVVLFAANANAQPADTAKVKKPWTHSLAGGLNLTQVSFNDNWTQGGENALAYATTLIGKSANDLPKTNWTTSYKFAFGQTKLGSQGIRKTDDKIDVESTLTFKAANYINPYVAATLKTQFAKGFDYSQRDARTGKFLQVSKFFDPGYLTQSAGLGYQPIPQIKTRLGAALREVITSEFNSYADDPKTLAEVEKTKVEGGLESVTEVNWQLQSNLLFTGKLELFDAFKNFDIIIMRADNTLAAKISKYVSVNFNVQLIKEPNLPLPPRRSGKIQAKQTLAIGLNYTFL
jgi:hypothetical protein